MTLAISQTAGRVTPARARWRVSRIARAVQLVAALATLAACGSTARIVVAPTPTATPRSSVVYVALGASDALGVGAAHPATQGYVPDLIAHLPAGAHSLNLGVSGIELHAALADELPSALAAHPTLVTIWLAANDFKDCVPLGQYGTDLNTLLRELRTQTHAQIFMANLPDMSQVPAIRTDATALGPCLAHATPDQVRALVAQWNAVIAHAAAKYGVVLVDLSAFAIGAHPAYVSYDGFHPSAAGYAQLANLFWAAITAHHAVPGA